MRLFGRGKKDTTAATNGGDAPQNAILQMRATIEMLEKKEKHLEQKINAEQDVARKLVTSNRSAALMAVKRKHMYEAQREHSRGARFNLETQMLAIENANLNMETIKAMKAGSQTMKSIHGQLDVGKVDEAMDDIREQMDLANEINEAISQPLAGMDSYGVDDDELNAELEQLEQSEMDRAMLDVRPVSVSVSATAFPDVSSMPIKSNVNPSLQSSPVNASNEDAELEELRQSMAL